jgi:hypothetical protein
MGVDPHAYHKFVGKVGRPILPRRKRRFTRPLRSRTHADAEG